MFLYRYWMQSNSEEYTDCDLKCYEFPVIRETPKCYIINRSYYWVTEKRCLKSADNKWYAFDTKIKALRSFKRRNRLRLWFLKADIIICEHWLKQAEEELLKLKSLW